MQGTGCGNFGPSARCLSSNRPSITLHAPGTLEQDGIQIWSQFQQALPQRFVIVRQQARPGLRVAAIVTPCNHETSITSALVCDLARRFCPAEPLYLGGRPLVKLFAALSLRMACQSSSASRPGTGGLDPSAVASAHACFAGIWFISGRSYYWDVGWDAERMKT